MTAPPPTLSSRLTLVEYRWSDRFVELMAAQMNVSASEALSALRELNRRLVKYLQVKEDLIDFRDGAVRVRDCAGILRIAPGVEFEVVPKFLSAQAEWREDFLLFATLADHGRLLPYEALSSGTGARSDLTTLIAQTMLNLFSAHQRRPLRQYRHRSRNEFSLDGEFNPETFLIPHEDGFELEDSLFDRQNSFNITILTAFKSLLPEVAAPEINAQLLRAVSLLAPQLYFRNTFVVKRLPSRHAHWQDLYYLALQVLRGYGVNYQGAVLGAPGYVLQTWQTWQQVAIRALQRGLPEYNVQQGKHYGLGSRNGEALNVYPDIAVTSTNSTLILLDAKYKSRTDFDSRIGVADIYESLAYLQASDAKVLLLLYPKQDNLPQEIPGTCEIFEQITIEDMSILGVVVECRGVSRTGFENFSQSLGKFVKKYLPG